MSVGCTHAFFSAAGGAAGAPSLARTATERGRLTGARLRAGALPTARARRLLRRVAMASYSCRARGGDCF